MKTRALLTIAIFLLLASPAQADPWAGLFRAEVAGESASLELKRAGSGGYVGTLTFMGEVAQLSAAEQDGQLFGRIETAPGEFVDLTVLADGTTRHVQFANGVTVTLSAVTGSGTAGSTVAAEGELSINGAKLSESERSRILELGLRIDPGHYWYDRVNGGWGYMGGPTMGFIAAGLPVADPLPENASNGETHVFVNGRNLPVRDWMLLSQLAGQQIAPGRYWLDANGYAGLEGGPALINFVAAAQQAAGAGRASGDGGGTWSSLLSSGGDDGQGNGFVQLPNGGFVSYEN